MLLFPLAYWQQRHLWLLPPLERQRPWAGSTLRLPPPHLWCSLLLKALRQRLGRQRRNYCSGQPPRHPLPSPPLPVFVSESAMPFSFGSIMYQPRARVGREPWPSSQNFPPSHSKWWGTDGPLDDIWWKYEGSGLNCQCKQRSKRVVTLMGNEKTNNNNGKDDH